MNNIYDINTIFTHPYSTPIFKTTPDFHSHTFFELSFVAYGTSTQTSNKKAHPQKRGDAYIVRPQDVHQIITNNSSFYKHIDIYVQCEKMKKICDGISPTLYDDIINEEDIVFFTIPENDIVVLENHTEFFSTYSFSQETLEAYHAIVIAEFLGNYLKTKIKLDPNYPDWLNTFIMKLYAPETFLKSTKEISEMSYYSSAYLAKTFKTYTGLSLNQYMTNIKMAHSLLLLSENNLSLLEISNKLGYDSQNNYIKNFKKCYGIVPSKWRKMNILSSNEALESSRKKQ